MGTGQQKVPEAVEPQLTKVSDISPPKAVVDEIELLKQELHDALAGQLALQRRLTDIQVAMVNPHYQLGDYVKASPIQRVLNRRDDAQEE